MRRRRIILLVLALAIIISALIATFLARARARALAERLSCGSQMIAIGIAARTWSDDHDGHFPTNFPSMSDDGLIFTKLLICPSDPFRHPAESLSSLTPDNCSYEIVNGGLKEGDAHGVFLRCKIHGFLGYADGSVYDNNGLRMKKN